MKIKQLKNLELKRFQTTQKTSLQMARKQKGLNYGAKGTEYKGTKWG